MKWTRLLLPSLLCATSVSSQVPTGAWPRRGGPTRDFKAPSGKLASAWPAAGPKALWSRDLGDGYSAIVTDGDALYTMYRPPKGMWGSFVAKVTGGEPEAVVALDPATGRTRWEHVYETSIKTGMDMEYGPGPHVTPLVAGGLVFTASTTGRLMALEKATGKERWAQELWETLGGTVQGRGYSCSPLAYGENVLVTVGGKGQAVLTSGFASGLAAAAELKMIIPTAVGGGTDGFFRIVAREAEPLLNEPVVIVNVAGAGGTLGLAQMVRAAPDGQTVAGVWLGPVTVSPNTMKVPYKPEDYVPVIALSSAPYVLCVKPDFPANNGKEFIDWLRANPGKLSYGTDGLGGPAHLGTARLLRAVNATAQDIPFKGAGETITAFLGGHVDMYVGSVPPVIAHVKAGKAKCVLVTSADRIPALPNVQSLRDIGLPDEETILWRAVLAPKGTPPARIAQLESAFERAANSAVTRKFLEDSGEALLVRKGTDLRQFIDREYAALAKVAQALNLTPK